jgi:hypothetical protein
VGRPGASEHGGVEYVAASDRDDGLYIFRHDPED